MTRRIGVGTASGVAFALLYFAALAVGDLPEGGYTDARVAELYADEGSRAGIIATGVLLGFAGIALVPFLADLRTRLRGAAVAADVAFAGGLLYVAALFGAGSLASGYAIGVALGELPEPVNVELARVLTNQAFGLLLLYGLFSAGVLVLATSVGGRLTGAVSTRTRIAGFVIAPLLLAGAAWMPQFLVPIWVLAVSLGRARPERERVPVSSAPAAAS